MQSKIANDDFNYILKKLNEEEKILFDEFYELDENSDKDKFYLLKSETEYTNKNEKVM